MHKQTAVEYLIEEYRKAFKIPVNAVMQEAIDKALAMEKEQMEEAVCNGISQADMKDMRGYFDFEKYYNETYASSPKTSDNCPK